MAQAQPHPVPVSHLTAVLLIASTAVVWGFGFPMTRFALNGGISVGALMSLRFLLAGIVFFIILRAKRIAIVRRGVLDGVWLGADSRRHLLVADRRHALHHDREVRLHHRTLRAVHAADRGCRRPAHQAHHGNRNGDRDLRAVSAGALCPADGGRAGIAAISRPCSARSSAPFTCILMGKFARRTDAWLLAGSQVIVAGIVSVVVTAFLPAPFGYQNVPQMLTKATVVGPIIYLALGSTVFAFWGQSRRADATRSRRSRRALLHRAGDRGDPQRLLAEGTNVDAAGVRRHADRGGDDRLRSAAVHVPRHHGSGYQTVRGTCGSRHPSPSLARVRSLYAFIKHLQLTHRVTPQYSPFLRLHAASQLCEDELSR